jgi:hypothetical protein
MDIAKLPPTYNVWVEDDLEMNEYAVAEAARLDVETHQDEGMVCFEAYAWPGGYPLYYYDTNGFPLCPICAAKPSGPEGRVVGRKVNYEDNDLWCDSCCRRIPSAYGDQ